jgi:hypothetical protein
VRIVVTLRRFLPLLAPALLIACAACPGPPDTAADKSGPFKEENTPANLKALGERLSEAVRSGNSLRVMLMTSRLVPDETRLKKALRDDVPPAALEKVLALHKKLAPQTDMARATFWAITPAQTEVQVHGATTEELAEYAKGSVAAAKFPGGARVAAQKLLRPGTTFYEVEFLEPGKDAGMKYHLFYWDGERWTMLGPVWQALK